MKLRSTKMLLILRLPNMEKCKSITKEIISKPCSVLFRSPIDQNSEIYQDYIQVVKKPMNLKAIDDNLKELKYRSVCEWYDDMVLVFQNAIDYYPADQIISLIAKYLLTEFKKIAVGMNIQTEAEWTESVSKVSSKLTKIISKPPSFQRSNPSISSLCQRAEKTIPPDKPTIASFAERLNSLTVDNDEIREDVIGILKEIEGMPADEISERPVDLEKLKPAALKSLVLYANEHA